MNITQSDQMNHKLKSTKEAIDKASEGQMKQSAKKHFQLAQKAQSANKHGECGREGYSIDHADREARNDLRGRATGTDNLGHGFSTPT